MVPELEERLLTVMDQKDHWAWPHFGRPGLSKEQLLVHFSHEYQTYVRDFPVMLARNLGLGPPEEVRGALAENIYEEQTGNLSLGVPHPELFLEMMDGLGFTRAQIEDGPLEPEAVAYRSFLDDVSANDPWQIGCAVLTIFVEGSRHERAERAGTYRRDERPAAEVVADHPMVKVHGCPPEKMRLVEAHRLVEGEHRGDAWRMILGYVSSAELSDRIGEAVERSLSLWLSYRDGVARKVGLER